MVFDFEPSLWCVWIKRFECFQLTSDLKEKDGAYQVNSLIYTMGKRANDILLSLWLTEDKQNNYDQVKQAFDQNFVEMHKVIFERAKFNSQSQAENFITAVHKLA